MKTSYVVQNVFSEVIGYTTQLCEAKRIGEYSDYREYFTIIKLVGPEKYEGYHEYYLHYDGKKYKKSKKKGSV